MTIIDAHAHIFSSVDGLVGSGPVRGLDYGRIELAEAQLQLFPPYARETSFPPEVLLANMDWAGVDRAVLLQGSFYGARNAEVIDAVQRFPDRFVGAAFWDPWADGAREEFDNVFSAEQLSILKLELSDEVGLHGLHPGFDLAGRELNWLWAELERRELILTVDLGPVGGAAYQTHALAEIVRRHPSLRVVICHLAYPTCTMEGSKELQSLWRDQVRLGKYDNVWFDLSALPHRAEQTYPYPKMKAWVDFALDEVGHDKLMWGTDAPGVTSAGTYPQLLSAYQELLDSLGDAERSAIFGLTAAEVYWA